MLLIQFILYSYICRVISSCIQLLVQDLEAGCESSLQVMSKIQWQNIKNVGDQSSYINSLYSNFKQTVPIIRDYLSTSRKYFIQFCHKFVNVFIPKFINVLLKCKLTSSDGVSNVLGCEQLLLDTHSLKTALLDLPSIGSNVNRKPPTSYTKVVVKDMTRAEMVIKIVMTPLHPTNNFTHQLQKLLPDVTLAEYQKILDMKAVRRIDQIQLIDTFKRSSVSGSFYITEYSHGHINSDYLDISYVAGVNVENNILRDATSLECGSITSPSTSKRTLGSKQEINFNVGSSTSGVNTAHNNTYRGGNSTTLASDCSRIRKLENLLKKRFPQN